MSIDTTEQKQQGFWQLWNMSFGFFGIQYGWALQMANTSAIYEYLGANAEQIPLLWLAAPVSGLVAQPLIGYLSDRTWTFLGRRRPYFLVGAIFSSIALVLMPNSSKLWMAAGCLWILDFSVNISMQPFRAFVADLLPTQKQAKGFAMQSFFIGAGSVVASLSPWLLNHLFDFENELGETIPPSVKISFYVGAAIFLITVVWTVVTTPENPPELEGNREEQEQQGWREGLQEMLYLLQNLPDMIKQLVWVQFFTWLGIFCIFLYFPPAVAHNFFGAVNQHSPQYTQGIEWAGICIAFYNGVCFLFSWLLPKLSERFGNKATHSFSLLCGGIGIISLLFFDNPYSLFFPMIGFGITWASTQAIPYTLLANNISGKHMGLYMGIFNIFVVIPQIIVALGLGWLMKSYLHNDSLLAVVLGGSFLILSAFLVYLVDTKFQHTYFKIKRLRIQVK